MINSNIAKGKWTQIKGEILKSWGKLTEDELDQTKGDLTQVAGLVQQKYGEAQEAVTTRINNFIKDIKTPDTDENEDQVRTGKH